MTDNSNAAPERIWAGEVDGFGRWWRNKDIVGRVEYIRADLACAQIAAAYRAAALACHKYAWPDDGTYPPDQIDIEEAERIAVSVCQDAILALTPDRPRARADRKGAGVMTDRYGNTRVAKIRAAYNDLRAAIRAGDIEGAERALDRYEPWVDYVFGAPKIKAMMWTVATGYGGTSFGDYEAQTMLGEYSCRKRRDGQWSVWKGERPLPDQIFDALEAAKAAAQADYERRILSELEGYDD